MTDSLLLKTIKINGLSVDGRKLYRLFREGGIEPFPARMFVAGVVVTQGSAHVDFIGV